jgi:4-hydroxybenzoate polyprenyltransferase
MNPIVAFFRLVRLPNLLIIALLQYAVRYGIIYPILKINDFHSALSEIDFFLIVLATVMIAAAGYIINDYFDLKADRINKPQRIIIDRYIKRRVAMGAHIVINILALLIAIYESYKVGMLQLFLLYALSAGLLWYYSISFKRQILIGNIVIAVLAALVPFIAGVYELLALKNDAYYQIHDYIFKYTTDTDKVTYDEMATLLYHNILMFWKWILALSFFAFLTTFIRELVKDMEDIEGDETVGCRTFPIVYGLKKSKQMLTVLLFILFVSIILYVRYLLTQHNIFGISYIVATILIPLGIFYLKLSSAKDKKDFTKLSNLAKYIILAGVIYPYIFAIHLLYFM